MKLKHILYLIAGFIFASASPLYCPKDAHVYLTDGLIAQTSIDEGLAASPFAMGFQFALNTESDDSCPEIADIEALYKSLLSSTDQLQLLEFTEGFLHGHSMLLKPDLVTKHGYCITASESLTQSSDAYQEGIAFYASLDLARDGELIQKTFEEKCAALLDRAASSESNLVVNVPVLAFLAGIRKAHYSKNLSSIDDMHHQRKTSCAIEIVKYIKALTPVDPTELRATEERAAAQEKQCKALAEKIAALEEEKRLLAEAAELREMQEKLDAQLKAQQAEIARLTAKTQATQKKTKKFRRRKNKLENKLKRDGELRAAAVRDHLEDMLDDDTRPKPTPTPVRTAAEQAAIDEALAKAEEDFARDEAAAEEKIKEVCELKRMRKEERLQRKQERALRRYQNAMKKAALTPANAVEKQDAGPLPPPDDVPKPMPNASSTSTETHSGTPSPGEPVIPDEEIPETLEGASPEVKRLSAAVIAALEQRPDEEDLEEFADDDDDAEETLVLKECTDMPPKGDLEVAASEVPDNQPIRADELPMGDASGMPKYRFSATSPAFIPRRAPLGPPIIAPYQDGFIHGQTIVLKSAVGTEKYFVDNLLTHAHFTIQNIFRVIHEQGTRFGHFHHVHAINRDYWIGLYNGICELQNLRLPYYRKGIKAGQQGEFFRKETIVTEIERCYGKPQDVLMRASLQRMFERGFAIGQTLPA